MKVIVERDSVSMGDDALGPHVLRFKLPEDAVYSDLFSRIHSKRFLARIDGEGHFWEAYIGNTLITKYKANSIYPVDKSMFEFRAKDETNNGVINVYFKYISSVT